MLFNFHSCPRTKTRLTSIHGFDSTEFHSVVLAIHELAVPYHCCYFIPSTSVDRVCELDKLVRPIKAESELDHSTASSLSVVAAPATVFFRNIKDKYAWIAGNRKQESQGIRTNISAVQIESSLEGNTDGIQSLV
ncbi:hypothetical protein HS088_TW10G00428 [Tripterygium wilfordii]|uniref:Uncharacterized protein n=1 Tax=Tripterygium wilfordii TaxID=458696 RepID=A0A7J7D546_TRIWF|nr:uncharacterized protein LOC120007753 [Tripterygium wilfordii]KAF5741431.1 hypothetical protein HS088_TW10G00428 [Tripterygium wilfordii]